MSVINKRMIDDIQLSIMEHQQPLGGKKEEAMRSSIKWTLAVFGHVDCHMYHQ